MMTPNSPSEHEENDFFDEVERELVKLTTARLEENKKIQPAGSLTSTHPLAFTLKTVIPANAGTHADCDVPTENNTAVTQRGYGSRPAPGVISGNGRNNKHHRNR